MLFSRFGYGARGVEKQNVNTSQEENLRRLKAPPTDYNAKSLPASDHFTIPLQIALIGNSILKHGKKNEQACKHNSVYYRTGVKKDDEKFSKARGNF